MGTNFLHLPLAPFDLWDWLLLFLLLTIMVCMVLRYIPNIPEPKFRFKSPIGKLPFFDGASYRGDVEENAHDGTHHSFYQVHWYIYPIMYWLELLMDFVCLENTSIDLACITELDPLWHDDEKSFILNPEAVLFGNPIAQAACAADCVSATTRLPMNELFWCSGCQGGLYPFTGTLNDHSGGVQGSLLIAGRFMAKLHRELLLWGTSGKEGLCSKYVMPIIKKTQYRFQMTYPLPTARDCYPMGHTEVFWQGGKEFPYNGSDFGYLIWRRRDCCLF